MGVVEEWAWGWALGGEVERGEGGKGARGQWAGGMDEDGGRIVR